ncbi:TrkA family potassium uptake protein [Actinobacteria bacterium YIM 96077]|uniref:TrkA family potassium uptake protein n=1 Tax=Phytoactinopolyspora halophila TaxID=1981511 RepID=A0A329QEL7_9ACTN|nr:TrkA family potassium uptake protein [Phytoactinopolyspora halophila]AYY13423.1 TrkA family potassium uptake protein [Actinobacteria bacterium YIM 96077]RAW10817.1 TrkA family potassium uptake protein [Phytoactinopolyspora halophila]
MHVVIMGCGRVGSTLAHSMQARGHTVAVIDRDSDAFRRLRPGFEGATITGIGFDRDVLQAAGIGEASAFAAVSSGDNSNVISARVARETFGVDNVVARIYDPGRAEVYERLGIPTVATVRWAADQVLHRLLPDDIIPEWSDPSGAVQLAQIPASPAWAGTSVAELERSSGCRVAFLARSGRGMIPTSETVIEHDDRVYAMMDPAKSEGLARTLAGDAEGRQ